MKRRTFNQILSFGWLFPTKVLSFGLEETSGNQLTKQLISLMKSVMQRNSGEGLSGAITIPGIQKIPRKTIVGPTYYVPLHPIDDCFVLGFPNK